MPTQIRGNTQIKSDTVTDTQINSAAAIASTKLAAWTANRDANSNKLVNLADPTNPQDAATRAWVLTQLAAISQGAVEARLATTANNGLSGLGAIDGVTPIAGDVVFVRAQTTASENGVYVAASGAWARHTRADTWAELAGLVVVVQEGTNYHDTLHLITVDVGGTLGTDDVTSIQLPGPSDIVAGAGLTRSGQTINVANADGSITVNADDIQVARDVAGAITLGTGLKVNVSSTGGIQISSNALAVKLDGASLTVGSNGLKVTTPTPNFVTRETPTGSVNGSNVTFTLANTPTSGSEEVYLNGVLQEPGSGNDYTISSATITFASAPVSGDRIRVNYRY